MPKAHPTRWQPNLAAGERVPGVWTMVDDTGRAYGPLSLR